MTPVSGRQALSAFVKLVLVLGTIAGFAWLIVNRQGVLDWWQLRQYKPTVETIMLAEAANMHGQGRDLFYISDPKVLDAEAFNLSCQDIGEQGSVLGCYSMQRIYIFNVTDERLPHVKEVTAAHEMLHAAYDRLDPAFKEELGEWLNQAVNELKGDQELKATLKLYADSEPGELLNELHSILGTEYSNLPTQLEDYYNRYFSDRGRVVAYAKEYKDVFRASKARIAEYEKRLDILRPRIESAESELQNRELALRTDRARLEELRSSNVEAYNQAVPGYNSEVRAFNDLARSYNAMVKEFNNLVELRNKEAVAQNDLYHSLDSKYEEL